MRRLALKTFLILLPFALAAGVVAWVDPFAYFPWNAGAKDPAREDIAYRLSPTLWKLAAFRHAPAPHLLLGDSRMASLDTGRIASLTGEPFANLGYGGGSLDEAIRTFWFADARMPLRSATFGINLDLYNESNAKDRVTGTEKILASPGLYLCDRLVLRATGYALALAGGGRRPALGVPPMSPDAFWNHQLDVTARIAYESYRYPKGYRRRLEEIAAHCRKRGIALRFVIFPEHTDLTARAARFGLDGGADRMRADLQAIGETVDLGSLLDRTDRSLFTDPYHFGPAIEGRIIDHLWSAAPRRF
ncbi:MAG: hypothetical protein ABIS67_02930 [Candidatus Eisenbacteria bacterium]